jgi:hypothetical protein
MKPQTMHTKSTTHNSIATLYLKNNLPWRDSNPLKQFDWVEEYKLHMYVLNVFAHFWSTVQIIVLGVWCIEIIHLEVE